MSPQLFTLDWASSIKDGHPHRKVGAGERGGVLPTEKRGRVLEPWKSIADDRRGVVLLLGELVLSSFGFFTFCLTQDVTEYHVLANSEHLLPRIKTSSYI